MKLPTFVRLLLVGSNYISHALSASIQEPLSSSSPTTTSTSELIALHKSLIDLSSITGSEANVTAFLASYLSSHDLTVELETVTRSPLRQNIYAYPGSRRSVRTLLTSHVDVVPPFWPYELRNDGTEVWGRGSVDAKGSVAAQVIAALSLLQDSKVSSGDIALLFVVGEETGGDGMVAANKLGLSWETVIFGEPTELKLAAGHKGALGVHIRAKGKAGHSGYPELGRNANSMLIKALWALEHETWPSSEKYGNTTLNIGRLDGGVAANVIAEEAYAKVQIRIADGSAEDLKIRIPKVIKQVCEECEVIFPSKGYGPVPLDHDVKGFETIVVNYGTDIPQLYGDHKKYLYGPGDILVAHSDHEHIRVADLETAVGGYKTLILESLK